MMHSCKMIPAESEKKIFMGRGTGKKELSALQNYDPVFLKCSEANLYTGLFVCYRCNSTGLTRTYTRGEFRPFRWCGLGAGSGWLVAGLPAGGSRLPADQPPATRGRTKPWKVWIEKTPFGGTFQEVAGAGQSIPIRLRDRAG